MTRLLRRVAEVLAPFAAAADVADEQGRDDDVDTEGLLALHCGDLRQARAVKALIDGGLPEDVAVARTLVRRGTLDAILWTGSNLDAVRAFAGDNWGRTIHADEDGLWLQQPTVVFVPVDSVLTRRLDEHYGTGWRFGVSSVEEIERDWEWRSDRTDEDGNRS